jgi:hypothetical protein
MAWDTATARARVGLAADDASKDVPLAAAMATALALAERYTDRRFLFRENDVAHVVELNSRHLHLYRWPLVQVKTVEQVKPDGSVTLQTGWTAQLETGVVTLQGWWMHAAGEVRVTFDGGYQPDELPADLEAALWLIFDEVWATTPGMGLPAGAGGPAHPVRSFAIDGMSIGYDTSARDGGAAHGAVPAWAISTLDFYRAESAVGGA